MASLQNTNNYVKFVRGTKTAWEALKLQNKVYDDTLYFIYESKDSSTGLLYLGTKLIGGTDAETEIPIYLKDLKDVLVASNIPPGNILVWNGSKWIDRPIEQIINIDSNIYDYDDEGNLTLKGFVSAPVGTIPQKDESGSISWIKPEDISEISEISSEITEINGKLENVYTIEQVNNLIATVDHLSYKIVDSKEDIDPAELGASNYIYLVPTNDPNNQYAEYMLIDGNVEPVGTWTVDLKDYVTVEAFNTKVGELTELISGNKTELSDLISENAKNIEALSTNLETVEISVGTLETNFNNLQTKVGDLNSLVVNTEGNTLVEQVNELTQQLTWQEIVE